MTPGEQGFLLLTGYLGDPQRKPLTIPQFRELSKQMQRMNRPEQNREMNEDDLVAVGCNRAFAQRVQLLLSQTEQMNWYLAKGRQANCVPITRVTQGYPVAVRKRLGLEAPGVLWAKGDLSLLNTPKIALVGSRELGEENRIFAESVGAQAAMQGYVLVSGNAKGADSAAQESCLAGGGNVICVVPDELEKYPVQKNVLYLSEDGFDMVFSPHRALQRNRIIHTLGSSTFVAQSGFKSGGTWDGTQKNLQYGWSNVYCFRDGSNASKELEQLGAVLIDMQQLQNISELKPSVVNFIEMNKS